MAVSKHHGTAMARHPVTGAWVCRQSGAFSVAPRNGLSHCLKSYPNVNNGPTALRRKNLIAIILFSAGAIWLAFQLRWKTMSALGFSAEWNLAQHAYVSIVNTSSVTAAGVRIRVRADYTYADAGYLETDAQYAAIPAGAEVHVPYLYMKDSLTDIGAMDIWITCDRGRAHSRWWCSYGMTLGDEIRSTFRTCFRWKGRQH